MSFSFLWFGNALLSTKAKKNNKKAVTETILLLNFTKKYNCVGSISIGPMFTRQTEMQKAKITVWHTLTKIKLSSSTRKHLMILKHTIKI